MGDPADVPADISSRHVPPAARRAALEAAASYLRCPVCGAPVRLGDTQLNCGNRHGFDIARQDTSTSPPAGPTRARPTRNTPAVGTVPVITVRGDAFGSQ